MNLQASDLLIVIPIIFASMAFHEAMHAFTAHWLGDTTARDMGRLTLNPLKHIDLATTVLLPVIMIAFGLQPILAAKPVPFNPARVKFDEYGAALIGISGPLSNLVLAVFGAGLLRILNLSTAVGFGEILFIFIVINLSFFVFNMLPIPPLDGSRLLYAFAPEPLQNVMMAIERMGFMTLLFILFLLLPVIGPIVSTVIDSLLSILLM